MPIIMPIYLDEEILTRVLRFIPAHSLSQFVTELLTERIAELEQAELEAQMREGYLAVKQDRQEINADWGIIDGMQWPT